MCLNLCESPFLPFTPLNGHLIKSLAIFLKRIFFGIPCISKTSLSSLEGPHCIKEPCVMQYSVAISAHIFVLIFNPPEMSCNAGELLKYKHNKTINVLAFCIHNFCLYQNDDVLTMLVCISICLVNNWNHGSNSYFVLYNLNKYLAIHQSPGPDFHNWQTRISMNWNNFCTYISNSSSNLYNHNSSTGSATVWWLAVGGSEDWEDFLGHNHLLLLCTSGHLCIWDGVLLKCVSFFGC